MQQSNTLTTLIVFALLVATPHQLTRRTAVKDRTPHIHDRSPKTKSHAPKVHHLVATTNPAEFDQRSSPLLPA